MVDATKTHIQSNYKISRPLLACQFSPDGQSVVVGSEDYLVWRVNVADGQKTSYNTDAWCRAIEFHADGNELITGSYDGRLIWWDLAAQQPQIVHEIEAHQGWIRAISISPDRKTLASVGNDRIVKLWDLATRKNVGEFAGHESHIYNVAFHPTQPLIVTGDLYGNLLEWNSQTGMKGREWKAETLSKYDKSFRAQIGGFRGLTFSPDGKQIAGCGITNVTNAFAGVGNPSVVVLDHASTELATEHLSKGPLQGVCWDFAFHSEDLIVGCSGGRGGYLLFWKPGEKEAFHQFKLPADVRDIAISPNRQLVAAALSNGHLAICALHEKVSMP